MVRGSTRSPAARADAEGLALAVLLVAIRSPRYSGSSSTSSILSEPQPNWGLEDEGASVLGSTTSTREPPPLPGVGAGELVGTEPRGGGGGAEVYGANFLGSQEIRGEARPGEITSPASAPELARSASKSSSHPPR
jgi:hypothetical protein